jgi:2-deoxy-D-gluconate 3-dehydrogenase
MIISELFNVSGKVAIVTGGSRGIGEMIAAGFLANGVKVYITARKEAALIEKAKELSDMYSGECIPVPCDLSTMEGMSDFVDFIQSKEEQIDFLINNAGASWGEPYAEYAEKGWDKVMDLMLKVSFT